ncbi:MAG TPA: Uma2 family endonuclease [Longimicrobium sp.]|nr:Uma2 family endonuclease [Longimicrobium sp.]
MQAQVSLPHRTWTVDEYYRMGEAGILGPDERTELIDGEIVPMTPPGPLHATTMDWLGKFLIRSMGDDVIVRLQNPLRLDKKREPQPDAALVRYRPDRFAHQPPGPADALLVIEVSESSLSTDRGVKRDRYAEFGIAEYWVLDISRRTIIAYRAPAQGRFTEEREYRDGESLVMPGLGREVKVEDVLGPAAR